MISINGDCDMIKSVGIDSGFFGWVMRVGNKLPNPFFLFLYLLVGISVLSMVLNWLGVGAQASIYNKDTGQSISQFVIVKNLLSVEYLHVIMQNFVKIYMGFPPLGLAMVTMLGIGYVQQSGFFDAALGRLVKVVPVPLVTFTVVLMSILSAVAGNAGILISATLAAAVFASIGKSPILGAVVGYASAHGGEPSNFILTGWKIMMSGITGTATEAAGIPVTVHPLLNYFFFATMVIVLALTITFVTEKIMPKLMDTSWGSTKKKMNKSAREYSAIMDDLISDLDKLKIGQVDYERRGLKWAGIGTLLYVMVILLGTIPDHGFLRNTAGEILPKSPFISGIVSILVGWFAVIGTCFGVGAGTIKSQHDVPKFMCEGLKDIATFLVVCFPAAMFVKFFGDSNISTLLSVWGSEWLAAMNFTGLPLALSFILLVMFLNLFVTNGASKWMIMAPIFVPMFYSVGFTPEMTQTIYEIGDTITDPIAPVNYYIPVVITIMEKYRRQAGEPIGIGDVISMTLPYSLVFGTILVGSFCLWYFMGWPIGPGVHLLR